MAGKMFQEGSLETLSHQSFLCFVFIIALHVLKARERTCARILADLALWDWSDRRYSGLQIPRLALQPQSCPLGLGDASSLWGQGRAPDDVATLQYKAEQLIDHCPAALPQAQGRQGPEEGAGENIPVAWL